MRIKQNAGNVVLINSENNVGPFQRLRLKISTLKVTLELQTLKILTYF